MEPEDMENEGTEAGEGLAQDGATGDLGADGEPEIILNEDGEPVEVAAEEPEKDVDEPPRFVLEEVATEESPEGAQTLTEIIHKGRAYQITPEKLVELAQKGFDYDDKVGPHGKLVEMVNADPGLATVINDYWLSKVGKPEAPQFEVKPLSDYEDESEWLRDALTNAISSIVPEPQQETRGQGAQASIDVKAALTMRDAKYADRVIGAMPKYIKSLSVADYTRIDSDMGSLFQFYDWVKKQEIKEPTSASSPNVPPFKVRSGGSDNADDAPEGNAWDAPRSEFQKQLDRAKGYQ